MPILAWVVISIILAATLWGVVKIVQRDRQVGEESRQAARRGWQLKVSRGESGQILRVYSGKTDGIEWSFTTGTVHSRWRSAEPKLGKEQLLFVFSSFGRTYAETAGPVPAYAGMALLDAPTSLKELIFASPGAIIGAHAVMPKRAGLEAYAFRATQPDVMHSFLERGAADILVRNANVLSGKNLVGLTVDHRGLTITFLETDQRSQERIAELAKIGAALTKAARAVV